MGKPETQSETTIYHTRGTPVFQENTVTDEDMAPINQLAPKPLRADQVYIRSMFLCSNQLCLFDGCRFTKEALEDIVRKVIGQSVLTGHNRTTLPLARFFKANLVERGENEDGEPILFVRAWFYWLRETTGANDLLLNIDGGVYREVSLAWKYKNWHCSICGIENGKCGHSLGERYGNRLCYRLIDHVLDVLEGSLVYKGADRNTYLTGARGECPDFAEEPFLLICSPTDPLFVFLEHHHLLRDQQPFDEISETLSEGMKCCWLRKPNHDGSPIDIAPLLTAGGIGLLETIPFETRGQIFGDTEIVYKWAENPSSATGALSEEMEN